MSGDDVALATYERRVNQLFNARRFSRAWKKVAKSERVSNEMLVPGWRWQVTRIAKLEDVLRPFAFRDRITEEILADDLGHYELFIEAEDIRRVRKVLGEAG